MTALHYAHDSRLIFDLGMNNGDDTAFYLGKGFNVVALEANPRHCEQAQTRFQKAIEERHLTILNAAISDESGEATFFLNLDNDHWSSLDINWASRDATRCEELRVECVTLENLFDEFGVPRYLKIDVEGVDLNVLEQLRRSRILPAYVSVEDCRFGLRYMDILAACGYNGFKLFDQSTIGGLKDPQTGYVFPAGSSGPFGDDVPGQWLSHKDAIATYSVTVRDLAGNRLAPRTHWWDIHCAHRN